MRFAILSPIYPYRGSTTQLSRMLYTESVKEDHEVKAFNFKRFYPDILFPGEIQYVEAGDRAIEIESVRVLDSVDPVSYFSAVNAIRPYALDILIISYWVSFLVSGYAHVTDRMKKHYKVITLIHNVIPHESCFFDKPLASLFFKQCHGFTVMSDSVRYDLRKFYSGARYIQSPHPFYNHFGSRINKNETCRKLGIHSSKKNLLFFGLIRDYKGLDPLIEATGQLNEDYYLIIAGECYGSFEKYQALIDASLAKERIFVHCRYISDGEISIHFSIADALVLPYRSTTQSGVAPVVYNYDLPVLSTLVGDFKNSIEKPGTGIVVPGVPAAAPVQGIKELFTPSQQATTPANVSKEKAAPSWETLTRKLPGFINSSSI